MSQSDPLSALLELGRAMLLAAGLARCQSGETVYFSGGQAPSPVLVLVHGVNDQAGTWGPVAAPLAKNFRVIVPDLPGHGESGPKTGPLGLPLAVERLHEVIEKEGARKVVLAGNSMGAWISILYTLAHPERVDHLILESGGGLALPPGVPMAATNREEAARILRAVHGPDTATPDWLADALIERGKVAPVIRVLQSNVFPHFVDARLKDITVPTTIVWGENDGVTLRYYVDKLQLGIAGSTLIVIPRAAHIPHAQQPERFVEIVSEVLLPSTPSQLPRRLRRERPRSRRSPAPIFALGREPDWTREHNSKLPGIYLAVMLAARRLVTQ